MLRARLDDVRNLTLVSLTGASILFFPVDLGAEDGTGTVASEATIYQDASNDNGGGYTNVCIGNHETTETTKRAFIRWNLPAIPSGSVITRVQVVMNQVRVRGMGSGSPKTATLQFRKVTQGWTEGSGIGPNDTSCGGGQDVAGVDWSNAPSVEASVSATEGLPSTRNAVITMDTDVGTDDDALISDVQFWLDNPASNFGWRLEVSEEATTDNARRMTARSFTVFWNGPAEPEVIFSNGFEAIQ